MALPAAAAAAAPSQIHGDAADGTIDGSYSLAELRAANQTVTPELREYHGWEEAYREYLRGSADLPTASPDDAGPPVPAADVTAIEREAPSPSEPDAPAQRASSTSVRDDGPGASAAEFAEPAAPMAAGGSDPADPAELTVREAGPMALDDEPSGVPFVYLLLATPLLVIAVGAWGAQRSRTARSRSRNAG